VHGQLAVIDAFGNYCGVLTAHALADALADGEHDQARVATITEAADAVREADLLDTALDALETAYAAVPVLDKEGLSLVGWLTHQRVLAAQRRALPVVAAQSPKV